MGRPTTARHSTYRGVTHAQPYAPISTISTRARRRPQPSIYRENSHAATALLHFSWPVAGAFAPQLIAGGSLLISSGSRPTTYYQPMVKLTLPAGKHLAWFAEWRYYGYGEAFYLYEGFRANLATLGVRYTR